MQKSIISRSIVAFGLMHMFVLAQTSVTVPWTGTPGEMETFIHGDTTSTGEQAHDIYVLEANKVYLQLSEVNMTSSMELVGAGVGDGEHQQRFNQLLVMMVIYSLVDGHKTM